jgi:hypothetical protein
MEERRTVPRRGGDGALRGAMMAVRAGFVVAIFLGGMMMAGLAGPRTLLPLHMGAGLVVLTGLLVVVIRLLAQGAGSAAQPALGLLLGIGGALGALGSFGIRLPGLVHLALMVLAISLAEMTVARLRQPR